MRNHRIRTTVLVFAVVTAVAQSGSAAAPSAAPASAGEPVTLRMTTWAGEDESAELQELVLDPINAAQDEFEIIHEPVPADYYTRVQTSLAGGTGADLIWLSQEYIAGFASRGALLDITDLVGDSSDVAAADVDLYFEDIMKTAIYEDQLYGLPWISQPVMLYYNPALFDAAGLDYPDETWDWETFKSTAEELTVDTDGDGTIDQYGFTASGWPPIHMFIWQAGGEVISDDLTTSPIDSPEAIEGASFYADLIFNEACCPSEETIAEQGFNEMFNAGQVAMFMGGAADTFDSLDTVGATVVPAGPANRRTFSWTASTVINSATDDPELAVRALAAITEGIHHWKLVPPRTDLQSTDVFISVIPEQWQEQKAGQVDAILLAAEDMSAFNIVPRHQEWDDVFWREFQDPLFHGQGTAEELAADARAQLEDLLP